MSEIEDILLIDLRDAGLPEPEREYRFMPERRFRADFAYPDRRILIEVEGGVYSKGRHVRGSGYTADCEKYTLAALEGWIVLRFTSEHVKSGWAREIISRAVESKKQ